MRFTILGAGGFIGSHLLEELSRRGVEAAAPGRDDWESALRDAPGHVIYCAGLTADFRTRPHDAVRAHVCRLIEVLERPAFESLLYLSSTRLYAGRSASEESAFTVDPRSVEDLYNLSKLTGESLCLTRGDPRIRVARLSNVYGPDWRSGNFLMTVIRAAVDKGTVELQTGPESAKDYISIADAVPLLLAISERGRHAVYNVASGINTSNGEIAGILKSYGAAVTYRQGAPEIVSPNIDVSRIRAELGAVPRPLTADLTRLLESYRSWRSGPPSAQL